MSKSYVMRNVYYFPNQERPWVFRKIVKGKLTHRKFKTKKLAENFAREFSVGQTEKGAEAMFFDRADKELLDEIRKICGDVNPLDAVKWWKANWNPKMQKKSPHFCGLLNGGMDGTRTRDLLRDRQAL